MTNVNLDALDERILSMLSDDARIPFLEVARECNVSGAAIHQRVQKLTKLGVIKGSQFNFDPLALGYGTCAFVGIFLKNPSDFDRVLSKLSDNHHLLSIIHDKLQPLGLQRTETIISFHEAISRQIPVPIVSEKPSAVIADD